MCVKLKISRSYYYKLVKLKNKIIDTEIVEKQQQIDERIENIYYSNKSYGSRKISAMLSKEEIVYSPFKTLNRMKHLGISSLYHKKTVRKAYGNNNSIRDLQIENKLEQQFDQVSERRIITSDLTYIKHKTGFYYVCLVVDLYNREIIAHGVSNKHDASFVCETLGQINLQKTEIFHTDRGKEFVNNQVQTILNDTKVIHSVSKPGCPYDNAVSENLFGIFKREWMKQSYNTIEMLRDDVNDFVQNYNYFRIHSKLNYKSPVEYRISK